MAGPAVEELALPGCFEFVLFQQGDGRGRFLKTFHEPTFRELGLPLQWPEEFVTTSRKGVLRGMHFQTPPCAHAKVVTCLGGRILDVFLDLRAGSATFGACAARELSAAKGSSIFLPAGLAHGFLALEEGSVVHYKVSHAHAPAHDAGVLWSSIPFDWPVAEPVLSERDRQFPPLSEFATPFRS